MARITESLTALLIAINVALQVARGAARHGPARPLGERRSPVRRIRRREARARPLRPARRRADRGREHRDDIEIYGAYVSPDPDLLTYWLADRIDERGWGIAGDSFGAIEMLRELGAEAWFGLGDRDLGLCLERRRLREAGLSATAAQAQLTAALGVRARVLPMSDHQVRTRIRTSGAWVSLQEFMIGLHAEASIEDIDSPAPPTRPRPRRCSQRCAARARSSSGRPTR